jgi:dihydrofolate reductase
VRLVVTQNITLDGAVEMLDSWFDPTDQDPELAAEVRRQDESCDALLLGRRTFEDFRGFWPHQTDDTTGVSDQLNRVQKYVVSSTLTDPDWQNSTLLTGDPVEEVRHLKQQPGADLVLTGSITLAHAVLAAGLVDELRLFTYPVVQGRGRRLFPGGHVVERLRLLGSRAFAGGITSSSYATEAGA